MTGSEPSRGVVSCVVDAKPVFEFELLHWVTTATRCAGIAPADLRVHAVGDLSREARRVLDGAGVEVAAIEPFDPRSPHCNKIAGALALTTTAPARAVVLTDTDMVFLDDPRTLGRARTVAGRVVDHANPPIGALRTVFEAAGVDAPPTVPTSWRDDDTLAGNFNGGLYVLDSNDLPTLAKAWERHARWLLDRLDLLGDHAVHVDQVAMCLAIASTGLEPVSADERWNVPTHDVDALPATAESPALVHYHRALTPIGQVAETGRPWLDEAIGRANDAISEAWAEFFPNEAFWSWRYATNPELGSGVGSRGADLEAKRGMLHALDAALEPASVLDVGCGDIELTLGLFDDRYTGLDLSTEAIELARRKRPDGTFVHGSIGDAGLTADLVVCLDVLIHQADRHDYDALLDGITASADVAALVSGYERPPAVDSPMVHFHEALSASLRRRWPDAELYPLLDTNDAVAWLALRAPARSHPRDFGATSLAAVVESHPAVADLLAMRLSARRTTGFYPDHAPRLWEYPMVARALIGRVGPGAEIVDVGAGVSPLARHLHQAGYRLTTVDPSSLDGGATVSDDTDEWGSFDDAAAGFAERSANTTLDALPRELTFDAAYSVSVIEHLPATIRRDLLSELASRVRPGGVVVLTVDVTRDTDDLWNRSESEVVDAAGHGTFTDLLGEVASAGLLVEENDIVRDWGDEPVDIGWIIARTNSEAANSSTAQRLLGRLRRLLSRG